MRIFLISPALFFLMPARRHIYFAANNRLYAMLFSRLIKIHRAVHSAVIRYGKAVKAQFLSP